MVSYVQIYTPTGANIQVYGAALSNGEGGTAAEDGNGGGYIRIASNYLDGGHGGLVWNVALHEVMHTANFHHSAEGCRTQSQMNPSIPANGPYANGPTGNDYCAADRAWRGDVSPIVLALDGGPIRLSSQQDGVLFDLRGIGRPDAVAWPSDSTVGFLALDRNGNGVIDNGTELFGNFTRLRTGARADNGYVALADFDDNGDGWIDRRDSILERLRIWVDRDRNGTCDSDELLSLADAGISALSLEYVESRRVDRWGNEFRYHAPVRSTQYGRVHQSWDVYLRDRPQLPH